MGGSGLFRGGFWRKNRGKLPRNSSETNPENLIIYNTILLKTPSGAVLGRKLCVESEFGGQGPPKCEEIEKIEVNWIFSGKFSGYFLEKSGNFLEIIRIFSGKIREKSLYSLLKPFKGTYLTTRV